MNASVSVAHPGPRRGREHAGRASATARAVGRSRAAALLLALVAVAWAAPAPAQTLYKSTGPDGRVVYSDKPPTDGPIDKTMSFENLPASPVPPQTLSYVEQYKRMKQKDMASMAKDVVLFSASWCGYCRKAKAYLGAKGIGFREVDIDTPDGREAFAQMGGGRAVPVLLVRGRRVQGFSPAAYDALLAGGR